MFDVEKIIEAWGIIAVALIVFAESGLLIGFFLPGDTLLFSGGLLASQGVVSLFWLIFFTVIAAIVGDNVGYSIGKRAGPRIFKQKDGLIFRQEYLERAASFYSKHGGKTIILARFMPIVRTFAPVVAGASNMDRKRFVAFNIFGGLFWGSGMTLLGYWLGTKIPGLDKYIEYVLLGAVGLSIGLSLLHLLKDKKIRDKIRTRLKRLFSDA